MGGMNFRERLQKNQTSSAVWSVLKAKCILPFWVVVEFDPFGRVFSSNMYIIPTVNATQTITKVQTSAMMSLMTLLMLITIGPNVS